MILLFNVKITQFGLSHYVRAPWLKIYNRVDIFKYCLASYAAMAPLITRSVFFIELADEFRHCQAELETYIKELFPQCELHWYRNFYTRDWRHNWDKIALKEDDLIWFAGNDDHIFMDHALDVVDAGLTVLKEDPNPLSAIFYSHWASVCRMSHYHNGQLTPCGNYVKFDWRCYDGIRIIKSERFRHYWFDNDFGDNPVYRTDMLFHLGHPIVAPVYAPTRELVRHYDGDSHIGDLANYSPPLVIPPGFFEKNIKIRIGYDDRKEDWVNLNPTAQWLHAATPTGQDYRWLEEDIPLFWRDRITEVDIAPGYDPEIMTQARNAAFLTMTRLPMHPYGLIFDSSLEKSPPMSWYAKHLRHV